MGKLKELDEKISQAAHDVESWIQDAVGDMAGSTSQMAKFNAGFGDDKWKKKIKEAEKNGVIDLVGWLADEYYDDVDTLRDLCGDRIHDETTQIVGSFQKEGFDRVYVAICEKMKESAHSSLKAALDKVASWHIKRLKERGEWKKTLTKHIS